jgi:hypothetical protein
VRVPALAADDGDKTPGAIAGQVHEADEGHGHRAEGQTIDAIVQATYGLPLSGKNGDTDSLEWRFLDWLAKGK